MTLEERLVSVAYAVAVETGEVGAVAEVVDVVVELPLLLLLVAWRSSLLVILLNFSNCKGLKSLLGLRPVTTRLQEREKNHTYTRTSNQIKQFCLYEKQIREEEKQQQK